MGVSNTLNSSARRLAWVVSAGLLLPALVQSAIAGPASRPSRVDVQFCLRCHAIPGLERPPVSARKPPLRPIDPQEYAASVHGKRLVCTDCHRYHEGEPLPYVPRVRAKLGMVRTCSKCHVREGQQYSQSIHARALAAGKVDAPACEDCHGQHNIAPPSSPQSTVSPAHIPGTCAFCHANQTIIRRYNLPGERLSTYRASFHGIAIRYGQLEAANCASCHNNHDILPASDPRSPVNPRNLPKTCGKPNCHPGATANFAKGTVHLVPSPTTAPVIYWVTQAYRVFVFLLIAQFVVLIILDLAARARAALRGRSAAKRGKA